MRKTPSEKSEVVSQALFSEKITILDSIDKWSLISTSDGYLGWVFPDSFTILDSYPTSLIVSCLSAHLYAEKDIQYGPMLTLPFGVRLFVVDNNDPIWTTIKTPLGEICYMQRGNLSSPQIIKKKDLGPLSLQFLGIPYTWGGRSSFGYDCSGFVQMLYSHIGIELQRDSCDQVADSRFKQIEIKQLQAGDLIFWGHDENRIRHVGLSLGSGQFIHATIKENKPWLRISSLTDSTWNCQSGAYSYRTARSLV